MAKSKKKHSSAQASNPAPRVASIATTTTATQVQQHVACHVRTTVSPKKGTKDSVKLQSSYDKEVPAPAVGQQAPLPSVAQTVAPTTPPPAEPAAPPTPVVASSNAAASQPFVQDTAKIAPAAATPAPAEESRLLPSIAFSFGHYVNLAVQAYTYPAYYTAGAAVGVATAVAAEVMQYVPFFSRRTK